MDPLISVPTCPVTITEVMSPTAMTAIVRAQQNSMACIGANLIILDKNIRTVMRALEEKPNAPVFPTSVVCVRDVVFGFAADAGLIGESQVAASNALKSFDPRAVFFGGDGTADVAPSASSVSAGWQEFAWLKNSERSYYALGDRDLNGDPLGSFTTAYFQGYIGGDRFYGKQFPDADLAVWFYNTGKDEDGVEREPEGINVGSAQHQWLQRSVVDSEMGFHILVQHMPPRSIIELDEFGPDVGPEDLGIKLVLTGHSHTNEHVIWNGVHYLGLSTATETIETVEHDAGYPDGDPPPIFGLNAPAEGDLGERYRWGNTNYACVARITARQRDVVVEVIRVSTGLPVHTFLIDR